MMKLNLQSVRSTLASNDLELMRKSYIELHAKTATQLKLRNQAANIYLRIKSEYFEMVDVAQQLDRKMAKLDGRHKILKTVKPRAKPVPKETDNIGTILENMPNDKKAEMLKLLQGLMKKEKTK